MSFNPTIERLVKLTDYSEFERLCCDVLNRLDYQGLKASNIQGRDGGKDGILFRDEEGIIFHFSCREDWDDKLIEDLDKTKEREDNFDTAVFVTNQKITGEKADKLRKDVREDYGLELDLYHAETLRSLLDSNYKDLRKTYLGIEKDYSSHVDEIISDLIEEKRKDYVNYTTKTRYSRLVILAVPNKMKENRMELFDEKHNFVEDKKKLNDILAKWIPYNYAEFNSRAKSESYEVKYKQERQKDSGVFEMTLPDMREPEIHEAKIFRNGTLMLAFDLTGFVVKPKFFTDRLEDSFKIIEEIYDGKVDSDEFLTYVCSIVNCSGIKVDKGVEVCEAEDYIFMEREEEKFEKLISKEFKSNFSESISNKINYFFNEPVKRENEN